MSKESYRVGDLLYCQNESLHLLVEDVIQKVVTQTDDGRGHPSAASLAIGVGGQPILEKFTAGSVMPSTIVKVESGRFTRDQVITMLRAGGWPEETIALVG